MDWKLLGDRGPGGTHFKSRGSLFQEGLQPANALELQERGMPAWQPQDPHQVPMHPCPCQTQGFSTSLERLHGALKGLLHASMHFLLWRAGDEEAQACWRCCHCLRPLDEPMDEGLQVAQAPQLEPNLSCSILSREFF